MREARVYYLDGNQKMYDIDTFEAAVLFYMSTVMNPEVWLVEISYINENGEQAVEFRYESPDA